MSRMYSATFKAVATDAIAELFFIQAPSDAALRVHEIKITQDASETSEQLPLSIFRTTTDQSAKGTAVTPNPLSTGDSAFGGVVRRSILTAETFATEGANIYNDSQNILNGWHILPTPETRLDISPSGRLVIKLETAPSASINVSGYIMIEEIGG